MTTRLALLAAIVPLLLAACNQRTSVFDRQVLVTAPSYAQVPAIPAVSSIAMQFDPGAVWAGSTTRGTLTLNSPVEIATVVTVSAAGAAVDINPAQVVMPAGARVATFTVAARNVAADVNVNLVASMNGVSVSSTLQVWTVLPTFFSYVGDATSRIEPGAFARFTPQTATIEAYCYRSQILGWVVPPPGSAFDYWAFTFGAPDGQPLRAGTYQVSATDPRGNNFHIARIQEPTIFCNPNGRFTVREIELAPSSQEVRKFWVTFEQNCFGAAGALRGDLRLTNVRPLADATASSCFR